MRHPGWLILVGLVLALSARAAQNPSTIPVPRPQAWVVDLVGVLSADDAAALNALGDAVHVRQGEPALAVVVIDSTGGADPRGYATDLFNRWRLGDRTRDNGLLLFVALNDRAAEIILGDGIDSAGEVTASNEIMQGTIVPRFRAGHPADAIGAGARACAERFFGVRPVGVESATTPPPLELEQPASPSAAPASVSRRRGLGPLWIVLAGSSGLFGFGGWLAFRAIARRRPRRCRNCATTMQRLDEAADDAHLVPSERAEERVRSVDYDVWQCPGCGAVEKLRYGRWFTSYSQCPLCGGVTKNSTQRTLQSATTMSSGLAEVHEKCVNCAYSKTYTRVIPRVSSSSSSSSGRSSGGGSSSGRGSSGRW